MTAPYPLDIEYRTHDRVQKLVDIIKFCVEDLSLSFDRWDEPYVSGPGLYFAIVADYTVRDHADPMGNNRWPVTDCRDVLEDVDEFYETMKAVGRTQDGAVVISVDGVVQEQMVRFRDYPSDPSSSTAHSIEYAEWMGSRHMSAIDTSARPEVIMTITLSAETGRVTVFEDGEYTTTPRTELFQDWQ